MRFHKYFITVSLVFIVYSSIGAPPDSCKTTVPNPFKISGTISLTTSFFQGNYGFDSLRSPFSYVASANITAQYKNLIVPVSLTFSEQERKSRQPFNQFGVAPRWKWLTGHFGYSNVTYSSFTLAGHSILGAGLDMNPGIFRFGFIYGRFNRTIPQTNNIFYYSPPSYSRKGYSARIGIGTEKNFFDLIILNVIDDSTTLSYDPPENKVTPAQNVIGGFNTKFHLAKKLIFEGEGAVSVITTNLKSDSVNGVEDNPFLSILSTIIPINISTEFYSALRSSLTYKNKYYSARIQYKRIDPNYQSMGAYYFNNDVQNITFDPSVRMFRQRLYLRGSIGFQNDDLQNTKKVKSLRQIGSLNFSYNPSSAFGIDGGFSNYNSSQQAGRVSLVDSIRLNQNTMNINLMPRYTINQKDRTHTFMVVLNIMKLNDKNASTEKYTELGLTNVMVNYTIGLIPQKISYMVGINFTQMNIYQMNSSSYGLIGGITKTMMKNKLSINTSASMNLAEYNTSNGWVLNFMASSQYKIDRKNAFNFNLYLIGNHFNSTVYKSFNEFKIDLGYVYTL